MSTKDTLDRLAKDLGGEIEEVCALPDGSGFATMTMPLPKDHWLHEGAYPVPPMPFRMGKGDPRRKAMEEAIWAAAKYAVRASTMRGQDMDFDPDALCQNMVVGMLGYHTPNALAGDDDWANPDPVPPYWRID